jgi:hypothetical protein
MQKNTSWLLEYMRDGTYKHTELTAGTKQVGKAVTFQTYIGGAQFRLWSIH